MTKESRQSYGLNCFCTHRCVHLIAVSRCMRSLAHALTRLLLSLSRESLNLMRRFFTQFLAHRAQRPRSVRIAIRAVRCRIHVSEASARPVDASSTGAHQAERHDSRQHADCAATHEQNGRHSQQGARRTCKALSATRVDRSATTDVVRLRSTGHELQVQANCTRLRLSSIQPRSPVPAVLLCSAAPRSTHLCFRSFV